MVASGKPGHQHEVLQISPVNPRQSHCHNSTRKQQKMPSQPLGLRGLNASSIVFGAQACFVLGNAVYTISYPAAAASLPGSPMSGIPEHMVQAMGITSLSTGTFFAIATYQRNLPVMLASLPGRLFAAVIFHRNGGGWSQVAVFETAMAAVMGAALLWDYYH
ncbi:unnamed protein product [Penicillium salamii]|nr:unnamed protein product [Penicillium salamii]CAG8398108.1 unnamed protein product [Penicillium salamii]